MALSSYVNSKLVWQSDWNLSFIVIILKLIIHVDLQYIYIYIYENISCKRKALTKTLI